MLVVGLRDGRGPVSGLLGIVPLVAAVNGAAAAALLLPWPWYFLWLSPYFTLLVLRRRVDGLRANDLERRAGFNEIVRGRDLSDELRLSDADDGGVDPPRLNGCCVRFIGSAVVTVGVWAAASYGQFGE